MARMYIAEWIWYMNSYRIFQIGYTSRTVAYADNLEEIKNHNLGVIDVLNPTLEYLNYVLCELEG